MSGDIGYLKSSNKRGLFNMEEVSKIILSVIIPIKIDNDNKFIFSRIKHILNYFEFSNAVEIIIVDSTFKLDDTELLKNIINGHKNTKYIYEVIEDPYSAAIARNIGAKFSTGEYIVFFDVDLICNFDFFNKMLDDIRSLRGSSRFAFNVYPCLYLSREYSRGIEELISNGTYNGKSVMHEALNSALKGCKTKVLYPAINTSTILVNKSHFIQVGGYDEDFSGHGYEDFFLLHELSNYYPLAKKEKDYNLDYKTDYPGLYLGFRRHFAFYSFENLFREMYTLHLYHDRDKTKKYYGMRELNSRLFQKKLKKQFGNIKVKNNYKYSSYRNFINDTLSKYGYNKDQTRGLYQNKNNASFKNRGYVIYRKSRKLILNPKDFFSDIRLRKYWR